MTRRAAVFLDASCTKGTVDVFTSQMPCQEPLPKTVSYFENAPYVGRAFFPAIPLNILPHYNTNAIITAWGRATQFTVGYNYKWDAGDASWIPSHF